MIDTEALYIPCILSNMNGTNNKKALVTYPDDKTSALITERLN